MPAASHYDPSDRTLIAEANQERNQREQALQRNWNYYLGHHRRHLQPDADGNDDNVMLNLCKQSIDRTVAFLVPSFPTIQLDLERETEAENWLARAWQHSGGAVLLANMALNGALHGHVFARVVPGQQPQDFPRIINLNGRHITVYWQADDFQRVLWYEIRWQQGREQWRQDIVQDEGRWLIYDYRLAGSRWELQEEVIWPHPLGPVVDWQHLPHAAAFYGADELPHAALNDAVNKVASDIARILRFHAYPRTIGTGFEASAVQPTAIDDFWTIANEQAKVFNLEMHSDLSASLSFLQLLSDTFLAESRVTMLHGDPNSVKGVTNLAIRALYMDMVAKNAILRRHYGAGIVALSRRLLQMGAYDADVMPRLHWQDALPTDQREEVEVLRQALDLGLMSPATAAARLGITRA